MDAIAAAVNDTVHHPTVISIAWGSPEHFGFMDPSLELRTNGLLRTAAARGITILAASGDHGARDAETENRLEVDFPASSPWVLSVGGTSIVSRQNNTSAESVWNDPTVGGSGGGVSGLFDRPDYQTNFVVPRSLTARPGRGVPDVAP